MIVLTFAAYIKDSLEGSRRMMTAVGAYAGSGPFEGDEHSC